MTVQCHLATVSVVSFSDRDSDSAAAFCDSESAAAFRDSDSVAAFSDSDSVAVI